MPTLESPVTIVPPGQGASYWITGDRLTFKLTRQQTRGQLVFAENVALPQAGPPPHVHHREDEIFYVIDGRFEFVLDDKAFTAGAGSAVFLPRGVTHAFRNVSDRLAKVLIMTTPAGFDDFIPAAGDPCVDPDQNPGFGPRELEKLLAACKFFNIELRPEWKASQPLVRPTPRELWVIGLHVKILLTSEQTNGACSIAELTPDPGVFVPPHRHKTEDEVFYVIEGNVEFELEGEKVNAPAGTLTYIPMQTLHGFRNATQSPAKMFNLHMPGGFDRFFEASGTVCTDRSKGPPAAPIDMQRFAQICEAHGMTLG